MGDKAGNCATGDGGFVLSDARGVGIVGRFRAFCGALWRGGGRHREAREGAKDAKGEGGFRWVRFAGREGGGQNGTFSVIGGRFWTAAGGGEAGAGWAVVVNIGPSLYGRCCARRDGMLKGREESCVFSAGPGSGCEIFCRGSVALGAAMRAIVKLGPQPQPSPGVPGEGEERSGGVCHVVVEAAAFEEVVVFAEFDDSVVPWLQFGMWGSRRGDERANPHGTDPHSSARGTGPRWLYSQVFAASVLLSGSRANVRDRA